MLVAMVAACACCCCAVEPTEEGVYGALPECEAGSPWVGPAEVEGLQNLSFSLIA